MTPLCDNLRFPKTPKENEIWEKIERFSLNIVESNATIRGHNIVESTEGISYSNVLYRTPIALHLSMSPLKYLYF